MTDHIVDTNKKVLTPADVERIRERADKATKGNWFWDVRTGIVRLVTRERGQVFVLTFTRAGLQGAVPCVQVHDERCDGECHGCGKMVRVDSLGEPNHNGIVDAHHPDLDFIAASRVDVPALCDALTQAWGDIDTHHNALAEREAELTRLRGVVEEGVGSVRRFLDKDEQVTKALGPIIDYVPTNINPPKGPGQIGGKICVTYCMNGG